VDLKKTRTHFHWLYSLKPGEAALLLLLAVLFLPSFLEVYNAENPHWFSIISLLWRIIIEREGTLEFRLTMFFAFGYLFYFFLKYVLVWWLYRFRKHLTTRRRVIILGVLSEIQMFLMSEVPEIIWMVQNRIDWKSITWTLPVPITLVLCIVLMSTMPQPDSESSWLEEKRTEWH
jgi:hypothetical protein